MSSAPGLLITHTHGGRVREAARRFSRPPESFIDFSSNMNVLAPPISVEDWVRWREEAERYPEDEADLRARLAEVYEIPAEWLLPTVGAAEAIYLAARLFAGKRVAILEPGFGEYARAFHAAGSQVERRTRFAAGDVFDAIILGNPNNPTGTLMAPRELLALLAKNARVLLVDEAFIEFTVGENSLLPALAAHPNLIVFRSLTKSWRIPGLRLGFLAASNHASLARLRTMQPPWMLSSITTAWGRAYLTRECHERMRESLRTLPELREKFRAQLSDVPHITVHPSAANFFLIELKAARLDATALADALARRGFLVRVCDSFFGLEPGRFLRAAVRTEHENMRFANAFAELIQGEEDDAREDSLVSSA